MRKFLFTFIALLAGGIFAASAGISQAPVAIKGELRTNFIPAKFSAGNVTTILFVERNYDYDNIEQGKIYSKDMQLVKTINVPEYPAVTATQSVQHRLHGPVNIEIRNSERYFEANLAAGEVAAWIQGQNGGTSFISKPNGTATDYYYPYTKDDWRVNDFYAYAEYYGDKYPSLYYSYVPAEGVLYSVRTSYDYQQYGFIGWSEPEEETVTRTPGVIDMEHKTEASSDTYDLYFTQHLFNQDDLYEWVIPVYTTVSTTIEDEYRISGDVLLCTGFKVMSENGSTVATISLPSGYYYESSYTYLQLFDFGDVYYFTMDEVRDENGDEYTLMYRVDPATGSVKMATAPIRCKVSPTTPVAGTPVTVELGETAGKTVNVSVFAESGVKVNSQMVQPGASHATIRTEGLAKGLYVVVVSDGTSAREATKIIVR